MQKFLDKFKDLEKDLVKIVVYPDLKNVIASAILAKIFDEMDVKFSLSFFNDLDKNINFLKNEAFSALVLLGFDDLREIERKFKDKKIFVFSEKEKDTKLNLLNGEPAKNCYLLSKEFIDEDLSNLIFLVDEATESNLVIKEDGIRINGAVSLLDALMFGFDPFIIDVTGEEDKIRIFLNGLGIDTKTTFLELNEKDKDKLTTALMINMLGSYGDLNEKLYIFKNEEGFFKSVREFRSLLELLVMLNKEGLAVSVCLGNKNSKQIALNIYLDYKKDIINFLKWFSKNRKTSRIVEKKNFVFISVEDKVKDIYLEKILDLLASFKIYKEATLIFSSSYTLEGEIKIIVRSCGKIDFDVRKVLKDILKGEVNGRENCAWGLIPQEKEKEILANLFNYGENLVLEEKVK